jgi:hypothetical protein
MTTGKPVLCDSKLGLYAMKKEYKLKTSEEKMLKKILESKSNDLCGAWMTIHISHFYISYC